MCIRRQRMHTYYVYGRERERRCMGPHPHAIRRLKHASGGYKYFLPPLNCVGSRRVRRGHSSFGRECETHMHKPVTERLLICVRIPADARQRCLTKWRQIVYVGAIVESSVRVGDGQSIHPVLSTGNNSIDVIPQCGSPFIHCRCIICTVYSP